MGKIQFITKEQQIILDEVKQSKYLQSNFYFTGGTALSSSYLYHRYSDDLDLFSQKTIENQTIFTLMWVWSKKHNFTFQSRFVEIVYNFNLTFENKMNIKVDFAYYPYKRLQKGTVSDGLEIDSLLDIAVNKLLLISQRTDAKDFVDLYFLLQKFSVWDLMEGVKVKFNVETEPFLLGADFLKIEDFEYLPKMIKTLNLTDLKLFFRNKAKEIGTKATDKF